MATTQADLIMEYFKAYPGRDIPHAEIVKWAYEEHQKRMDKPFADPDRTIRKLHQSGQLIKVKKGVYRYDPQYTQVRNLEDFTPAVREAIYKRDNYRCVICGLGRANGVEIHADHVKPKDKGGQATLENGQTLCAPHNFRKKNYNQTESGKRMFIRLYEAAESVDDKGMMAFCRDILKVYQKHDINGHIEWNE
jgi:5-methylcytosine-specific restriction endonuclease McrA